ncbi:hypothetical protein PGB90_006005 [Kerria lacca]
MDTILNYDHLDNDKIKEEDEDEIIRFILNERKHTLPVEDIKILEKRDKLLKADLQTLQNVNFEEQFEYQHLGGYNVNGNGLNSNITVNTENVELFQEALREVEFLVDSNLFEENSGENIDFNCTVANIIHNDDIKNQIVALNEQIESNSSKCRQVIEEAKIIFSEKMNVKRELHAVEERIQNYSSEDTKIKKIKKKKGADCANTGHQKKTYFCRFGIPYFKTKERFPAYPNKDAKIINQSNQVMLYKLPRVKRFRSQDARVFDRDILKQLKMKRIEQLKLHFKQLSQKEKEQPENEDQLVEQKRKICKAIEETENAKSLQETREWNITIDFSAIVTNSRFNCEEYERMWNLLGNPLLCRDEFSPNEIENLKNLADEHGTQDWDGIACLLNTNRSGFMCFTKYASIQKKGKNRPWTSEEDDLLRKLGCKLDLLKKSGNRQWWMNVRRQFPHRTYAQIHSHWMYVLEPKLKKGRFTSEEHDMMERMLKEGKSYSEIAKIVQNRSVVQIRSHFDVKTNDVLNKGTWTSEEENLLFKLVKKYGTSNWVKISEEMKTRTRTQCRLKYFLSNKAQSKKTDNSTCKKGVWTEEENQLFKKLFDKYGMQFSKISEEIKTKTKNQCLYKYQQLVKSESISPVRLKKLSHKKKIKQRKSREEKDFHEIKISEKQKKKIKKKSNWKLKS